MERKILICPETGNLEQIALERAPLGRVIVACTCSTGCTRECARRMDRRDRLDADDRERVLLIIAAAHTPTARIADALADHLRSDDLVVERVTLGENVPPPLADYDVAVIGIPVGRRGYSGRLAAFVHGHAVELDAMPVFVFAVGRAGRHDPAAYLAHLTEQIGLHPAASAMFDHEAAQATSALLEFVHQIGDDIPAKSPQEAKRVLVVDDNVDSAELMAEVLRCKGLDVSIATHPRAALAMLATFSPQVALLDIGLPGIDGYELARRIARTKADCRLIAITGYGDARARARAREAGFSAHLVKPVTVEVLLAAISGDGRRIPAHDKC